MRILVVSDTHGDLRSLIKAVDAQRKAEIIVHCGDGEEQQRFLKRQLQRQNDCCRKGQLRLEQLFPVKGDF